MYIYTRTINASSLSAWGSRALKLLKIHNDKLALLDYTKSSYNYSIIIEVKENVYKVAYCTLFE